MAWVEKHTPGAPLSEYGYAGSWFEYEPDSIDAMFSQTNPETGASIYGDPNNPAHVQAVALALLRGAGMQPGSYHGAGVGTEAIDKLYASDPRFAQFFPDKNVVYQDVLGLMDKQRSIDAGAGDNEGGLFGVLNNVMNSPTAPLMLGTALLGGVGAFNGLFDSLGSSINVSSGSTPGTYLGSSGADLGVGMDWWGTDYMGDFGYPSSGAPSYLTNPIDYGGSFLNSPYSAVASGGDPSMTYLQGALGGGIPSSSFPLDFGAFTPSSSITDILKQVAGGAKSLLGGSGATQDEDSLMRLLGRVAPSLLGAYASNQQASKLSELAQKYQDFGAPYRAQLANISANPDNFYNSLGAQKATDAVLNKLSIGGNPAGSPNKQALTIDALYDQYGRERDRLAGFGGLTNYNAAAPNLEAQAIGQNANMWNAIGAGANDIFNPKPSLSELFKQMKAAGAF